MKKIDDLTLTDLAIEMAVKFENDIPPGKLARWVGIMNDRSITCVIKLKGKNHMAEGPFTGINFLNAINWALLPGLIECKNKAERIDYLKEELPRFLCINRNKLAISEIGTSLMHHIESCTLDADEVYECLDIFKAFIGIIEIYSDYEYLKKESLKAA